LAPDLLWPASGRERPSRPPRRQSPCRSRGTLIAPRVVIVAEVVKTINSTSLCACACPSVRDQLCLVSKCDHTKGNVQHGPVHSEFGRKSRAAHTSTPPSVQWAHGCLHMSCRGATVGQERDAGRHVFACARVHSRYEVKVVS
jgi:hypothetical protein